MAMIKKLINKFKKPKEGIPEVAYIDRDIYARNKSKDINAKKGLVSRLPMNKKYELADYIQLNGFLNDVAYDTETSG